MIEYSKETLYHYRCGSCGQWWTIADRRPPEGLACPMCLFYQSVKKIDAPGDN